MDYQTQQFKLLPLLATAYAMTLAGETLSKMYFQFKQEAAEGRFDSLPEVNGEREKERERDTERETERDRDRERMLTVYPSFVI